ncbi:MAG TPA: dihydropteroate synthase [Xanthomonadales bacterium]|nr:dihydropteroate synthase [Xanthomonadales bacterium]
MFEAPVPTLRCGDRELKLDRCRIMAILNTTPDSFSDGGEFASFEAAVARAKQLVEQGADIIDVGGESTRPGAAPVSLEEELARVVPVVEAIAKAVDIPVSIDTSRPDVMRAAVAAGAGMINDVRALRLDGALDAAAELKVPVCLMHMQGEPATMQDDPQYDDVVGTVHRFLTERLFACEMAGMERKQLVVDPGFGFGKTYEHNLELLRAMPRFAELGIVMAGLSRKGMIGTMTGKPVGQRAVGSAAAALLAAQGGALLVRVHDVAETRDALAVLHAVGIAKAKAGAKQPFGSMRFGDD